MATVRTGIRGVIIMMLGSTSALAGVTNFQASAGVHVSASVQAPEGKPNETFEAGSTNLPIAITRSAHAAAGTASAASSASASVSADSEGARLSRFVLSASTSCTARGHSDPDEGAGGTASSGGTVSFGVTEVMSVTIQGSTSASGDGLGSYSFTGDGVSLINNQISGDLSREVTLLPGISYGVRIDAGSRASLIGVQNGSATVSLTVTLNSGTNRFVWVNRQGGSYYDTNNWSPPHVPVKNALEADIAVFDLPVQYVVDSSGAAPRPTSLHALANGATADRWVIEGGEVRNIGGATLSSTSTEQPSLSLGNGARLNLQSGTLRSFHTRIGDLPGNRSDVWVIGQSSRWENDGFLFLGDYGPGQLLVFDGFVSDKETRIGGSSGATGEAFVRGSHAEWLSGNMAVGYGDAAGSVDLENGGSLFVDELYVGFGRGGSGRVTVTGGGTNDFPSLLICSNKVEVGVHGPGELSLVDGGWAQSTKDLSISVTDHDQTGTVRVRGVSADGRTSFLFFDGLNIGGNGLLEVADGGAAEFAGVGILGYDGGAHVSVGGVHSATSKHSTLSFGDITDLAPFPNGDTSFVVTSGGLAQFGGELRVGLFGNAFVVIEGNSGEPSAEMRVGGALKVGNGRLLILDNSLLRTKSATIGFFGDKEAQVTVSSDRSFPAWIVDGSLQIGGEGKGTLLFFDGLVDVSQSVSIVPGQGMLCGNGIVHTPEVTNAGIVCPGNSPGTLTIDGNFTQTEAGRLIIEIAGTGSGEYDVLNVTGETHLGGQVEYRIIDFFHPQPGDTIEPLRLRGGIDTGTHMLAGQPLGFASVRGAYANGRFQITSAVETNYNILHAFGSTNSEGINGWGPLAQASDGFLYGCARNGGPLGSGGIFRIHPDGYDFAVLHLFDPETDGAQPLGGVIQAGNGLLYGTASLGGTNNSGTIWRMRTDGGDFTVLHHFAALEDVRTPSAELRESSDHMLYGTGFAGGGFARGGIFRLNLDGSGYTVLSGFGGNLGDEPSGPVGGLVEAPDHTFYGTTESGGATGKGAVYRFEPSGNVITIKSLGLVKGGAEGPNGTLLLDDKGQLFGTTSAGGTSNFGTVFTLKIDGSDFAVLKNFGSTVTDAREPRAGLVGAGNGFVAGTTRIGGQNGQGAIYLLSKDGSSYRVLHSFAAADGDGARSRAPLIQPVTGVFYGSTFGGGAGDRGTLFRFFAPELVPPPVLSETPETLVVSSGGSIALQTAVTNSYPVYYQWQHAGTNIPGARGPTLTLGALSETNSGTYRVSVRNLSGQTADATAQLAHFSISPERMLTLAAAPGSKFRIETTDTLSTPAPVWQPFTEVVLDSPRIQIPDPLASSTSTRFYRCALLPL